jgi:glutathione S-transferase
VNATSAPYRLQGYEVSYFTAKVRAALRYKGVWFDERRADIPDIRRRTGYVFIPIVVTPEGDTWQDSTEIYDRLEARHPDPPLFPSTPVQRIAAHVVELYTDEIALVPAMHYRWGVPEGESTTRMRFTAMIGNEEFGKAAADRMAAARLSLGANDESGPAIEAHTRELLDTLSTHFELHPFLLGDRASFADCACMGPFYAHLFTDLPSRRLLLETAFRVVGWIERCNHPNEDTQGAWLADDALAPTFCEVLRVMSRNAVPFLLAAVDAFEAWADGQAAGTQPPRALGTVEVAWEDRTITRVVQSYTTWMVQRTLDAHAALDPSARTAVDAALVGTGWEPLLARTLRHRITKDGFDLVLA